MADWLSACLRPDWPAPASVRALQTTRLGGTSPAPWASFNLGDHVQDDPARVQLHRAALQAHLPTAPAWLNQVHGIQVVNAGLYTGPVAADAAWAEAAGQVCVVMTADCLPVLFCDRAGRRVAAAHAGWRGLLDGVLEATLKAMQMPGSELMAWLGPAIGPAAFEVGDEVRTAFLARDPAAVEAFRPSPQGRWLADIYHLARQRLTAQGVTAIYGGQWCTVSDQARFFSYRRDGQTGRMASLIWLA